jgi:hypothetical protein
VRARERRERERGPLEQEMETQGGALPPCWARCSLDSMAGFTFHKAAAEPARPQLHPLSTVALITLLSGRGWMLGLFEVIGFYDCPNSQPTEHFTRTERVLMFLISLKVVLSNCSMLNNWSITKLPVFSSSCSGF